MTVESGSGTSGAPQSQASTEGQSGLTQSVGESQSTKTAEAAAVPAGTETQTPPAYAPNLKYKVLDQEKEFPDWAKTLVKDQNLEKSFRDLLEKADGIEHVKTRRDTLETENKQMKEQWGPVVQTVQLVQGMLGKKDYESLFEALGIPEVELFKYVNNRLQLRENPQQFAAHEQQRQLQLRNQELEAKVQTTEQMAQEMAVQRRTWELDMELTRPQVSPAIQAFEQKIGRPGAFKAEVIRRGQAYAAVGQDIPVQQAVQEVLQLIGWQGQSQAAPQSPTMQVQPQAVEEKPTLPNLRGKGTSPTKVVPKSTEDLRKLAREYRGL